MTEPSCAPDARPWRASYLSVTQTYNLNLACRAFHRAFHEFGYGIFQVGSSLTRPDYRDVDLRLILADAAYDAVFGKNEFRLRLLNAALSEWLAARSGLPIDFQFQRMTEANRDFTGARCAMGLPEYGA